MFYCTIITVKIIFEAYSSPILEIHNQVQKDSKYMNQNRLDESSLFLSNKIRIHFFSKRAKPFQNCQINFLSIRIPS